MAEVSVTGSADDAVDVPLDIVTICRADHWLDEILPRFAALIDANCTGTVRRHLLLLPAADAESPPAEEGRIVGGLLEAGWHTVVCRTVADPEPQRRLLFFDALRADLLREFGLREALYLDPDTDVVADLQGLQRIAPAADLLWVANPLLLEPVLADLRRQGLEPHGGPDHPVLLEPGFLYLRRDLAAEFAAARQRFPEANGLAAGSTYWNMVMLALGAAAARLPDEFNRTFWDVPAAVTRARTVHYTGHWKHLQPFVEYQRPDRRLVIRPDRVVRRPRAHDRLPAALSVIALYRDSADYLPHALSRFEAWERDGLPIRYTFLENDSEDATPHILARFMHGRRGTLESRRLAIHYERRRDGQGHDRIMPLARMRNFITDVAAAEPPIHEEEWTLLIDSDIFFPPDILARVFDARAADPRPESIGMLTCYTQQLYDPAAGHADLIACPEMPSFALADHYFDTYAFHTIEHRHLHPFCGFSRCRRCPPGGRPASLPVVPADRPIVDVAAAFGGFALVPSQVLRDPRIRWHTYGHGIAQDQSLSEHVTFCDRLRSISGRRVVVLQHVDCVYRR